LAVSTKTAQEILPMHRQVNNFLSQSHAEATLADHYKFHVLKEQNHSQWSRSVHKFLKANSADTIAQVSLAPHYDLPNIHRALARAFPDWKLCKRHGLSPQLSGGMQPATFRLMHVRPDKRVSLLAEGSLFFEASEQAKIRKESKIVANLIHRKSYLRKQVIRPSGNLIFPLERLTWDDIALPRPVVEALLRNTVGVLERRAAFRRYGVPLRRGVLLYGPPGTGKTMIGKILAGLGVATFIWVTAADIEGDAARVCSVFKMARRLRPTILFFEDLDFHAADRKRLLQTGVLGELLTQMDGLESNNGVIVVATTNDLASIEPAIKDRPSRFDAVLEIGLPNKDARRQIIQRQLETLKVDAGGLELMATATEGLTGAQVREVAIVALQEAIFCDSPTETNHDFSGQDHIRTAIAKITGQDRRLFGFAAREECLRR
jgi:SpoVK/Ycf46/Vps4 family AAA+-type ATPase